MFCMPHAYVVNNLLVFDFVSSFGITLALQSVFHFFENVKTQGEALTIENQILSSMLMSEFRLCI